jgi:hypothetical protein
VISASGISTPGEAVAIASKSPNEYLNRSFSLRLGLFLKVLSKKSM